MRLKRLIGQTYLELTYVNIFSDICSEKAQQLSLVSLRVDETRHLT